jgi:hypothetical protein
VLANTVGPTEANIEGTGLLAGTKLIWRGGKGSTMAPLRNVAEPVAKRL